MVLPVCVDNSNNYTKKCSHEGSITDLSQGRKKLWLNQASNPGPFAYCTSTLPIELPSHLVVL